MVTREERYTTHRAGSSLGQAMAKLLWQRKEIPDSFSFDSWKGLSVSADYLDLDLLAMIMFNNRMITMTL